MATPPPPAPTASTTFYTICRETKIMECMTCGKRLSGINMHNMKRHYKLMHQMDILVGRKRHKIVLNAEPERYEGAQENAAATENDDTNENEYDNESENTNENDISEQHKDLLANEQNSKVFENVPTIHDRKFLELRDCEKFKKHKDLNKTECLLCGRYLSGHFNSNIKRHFQLIHNYNLILEPKRKRKNATEKHSQHDQHDDDDASSVTQHEEEVEGEVEGEGEVGEDEEEHSLEPSSAKKPKLKHPITIRVIEDSINIDRNKFLKCCLGLVAVKGLPARLFDDNEFFKILIAPQEEKFCTNLNSDDILTLLQRSTVKIRDIIMNKVKNKIVSLKLDITTEMYNKVLSIGIQCIDNYKMRSNTLDLIRLDKTTTDIKKIILNCLESYEISKDQIYCYIIEVSSKLAIVKNSEDHTEDLTNDVKNKSKNKINDGKEICSTLRTEFSEVKCAGNIIQLTVAEVLSELEPKINDCRTLIRDLQSTLQGCRDILILDNNMDWLTTYEMLKSLLLNRAYLEIEPTITFGSTDNRLDWNFIEELTSTLTPLVNLDKQLDKDQYIFGDFYRDWLSCEIELEELLSTSLYAQIMVEKMQKYKKELLTSDEFLAALYLDPRFNFCSSVMLSEEQKRKAEAHLVKLYKVIRTTFKNQVQPTVVIHQANPTMILPNIKYEEQPSTSKKAYDKLTQRIMNLSANLEEIDEPQRKFKQKLITLLSSKMMAPLETDVLRYWCITNFDAEITSVIEAALTVPVRQVNHGRGANDLCYSNEGAVDRDLLMTKYNFQEIIDKSVQL